MNHLEKEFQLASFHPSYQFMGSSTDDVTNYTNKSPFPIIHILRSDSILKARLTYPDTLKIPQINIDKLKLLGIDGWIAFCKENQLSILL
jgi:hypothetical protein